MAEKFHQPATIEKTNVTAAKWKIYLDEIILQINSQSRFFPWLLGNKLEKMCLRMRRFLMAREQFREYSTKAYYVVRMMILELDKRSVLLHLTEKSGDLFYLHFDEIISLFYDHQNKKTAQTLITYRKKMIAGLTDVNPPNEFGKDILQAQTNLTRDSEGDISRIKGIGCSPGTYRGRAYVAVNLDDAKNIPSDAILITKFTDPGWTPILAQISGVVTEVGGILSHAAVIGREYEIPAILNINNATKLIPHLALIEMNGATGIIQIIKEDQS
jgi:phosphohistidine swiveling domain-containing protein